MRVGDSVIIPTILLIAVAVVAFLCYSKFIATTNQQQAVLKSTPQIGVTKLAGVTEHFEDSQTVLE
jgi:hypothetical protein